MFSLNTMDANLEAHQKEMELQVRNRALVREASRKPKTRHRALFRLGTMFASAGQRLQARYHAPATCC